MDGIKHRMVSVNGIKMHVAEKGEGPVVLFLHGYPELWYTWRHQILALSSLGYRTVAPDLRGFGDTEAPGGSFTSYTVFHIVGDIIALIDLLGVEQVFVVGHDFGAIISWFFCLFRPERVKAFVCLGIPYLPRNPNKKPIETLRAKFGDDYYICRIQESGRIEANMARIGAKAALERSLGRRAPGPPAVPNERERLDHLDPFQYQPNSSWLSEKDLDYYATKYEQKGFTGGLNYYRALDLDWELTAAWNGLQVKVPVKFIVGEIDSVYTTPGVKEYVQNGDFKKNVPLLEEIVVMADVAHHINQERPEEINSRIYNFIKKF